MCWRKRVRLRSVLLKSNHRVMVTGSIQPSRVLFPSSSSSYRRHVVAWLTAARAAAAEQRAPIKLSCKLRCQRSRCFKGGADDGGRDGTPRRRRRRSRRCCHRPCIIIRPCGTLGVADFASKQCRGTSGSSVFFFSGGYCDLFDFRLQARPMQCRVPNVRCPFICCQCTRILSFKIKQIRLHDVAPRFHRFLTGDYGFS